MEDTVLVYVTHEEFDDDFEENLVGFVLQPLDMPDEGYYFEEIGPIEEVCLEYAQEIIRDRGSWFHNKFHQPDKRELVGFVTGDKYHAI